MHSTTEFLFLFLVIFIVFVAEAGAAPTRRQPGLLTLPIRSLQDEIPRDLHPQLYLQQHINRAERRHARMSGRTGPSEEELRSRLHKRMYLVGDTPVKAGRLPRDEPLDKRYNPATTMLNAFRQKMSKLTPSQVKAATKAVFAVNATGVGGAVSSSNINAAVAGTLTPAIAPTGQNSLGLSIEAVDVGYVAQIQLGTPPKSFQILMDSGSADFWVGSEHCQSLAGGGCGNHQFLGPQVSSSFADTGAPFNVTYGSGSVAGTIVNDTLTMAGLTLRGHTFGVASIESVDFSSDSVKFDGLMGLAQSGLSQQGQLTPIESLAAGGLISTAVSSYKISRLADKKNDGEITFGGVDTTKFDQSTVVTLNNVNKLGFWEANLDAVTVNGGDTGLRTRTAILDTGTTLLFAPIADAAAIHNLIPGAQSDGQGGFTIPCTTNASVALSFGGRLFNIDPRDLRPLPVDPTNPAGNCISGITGSNIVGPEQWLVGDLFLKNAYYSTNVQTNTLSLAELT